MDERKINEWLWLWKGERYFPLCKATSLALRHTVPVIQLMQLAPFLGHELRGA
jgi:hypothetical protein